MMKGCMESLWARFTTTVYISISLSDNPCYFWTFFLFTVLLGHLPYTTARTPDILVLTCRLTSWMLTNEIISSVMFSPLWQSTNSLEMDAFMDLCSRFFSTLNTLHSCFILLCCTSRSRLFSWFPLVLPRCSWKIPRTHSPYPKTTDFLFSPPLASSAPGFSYFVRWWSSNIPETLQRPCRAALYEWLHWKYVFNLRNSAAVVHPDPALSISLYHGTGIKQAGYLHAGLIILTFSWPCLGLHQLPLRQYLFLQFLWSLFFRWWV